MYSKKIQYALKAKKIKIGNKVQITKSKKNYIGLLMPKTEFGDPNCMVIKLKNGYNIGLDSKGIKIKKL